MNDDAPTAQVDRAAEQLDMWAFIELFGHSKIAGRVTERKVGTESLLQVDVCANEDPDKVAYSRLFNPKAIFSINPTSKDWCWRWAKTANRFDHQPVPFLPGEQAAIEYNPAESHDAEQDD